ncbi:MBL fold metallo-hydrolase [Bradyrhizobium sp. SEMIA]|nr:MBL fold metallo-hydrolase [Bradyrhizobium sp. SEMIA]
MLQQNALVVNTGDKLILFDTGMGSLTLFGPTTGRLMSSLKLAGIDPKDVDAVVMTHAHIDHCGGCMADDGSRHFPNAEYFITQADPSASTAAARRAQHWPAAPPASWARPRSARSARPADRRDGNPCWRRPAADRSASGTRGNRTACSRRARPAPGRRGRSDRAPASCAATSCLVSGSSRRSRHRRARSAGRSGLPYRRRRRRPRRARRTAPSRSRRPRYRRRARRGRTAPAGPRRPWPARGLQQPASRARATHRGAWWRRRR